MEVGKQALNETAEYILYLEGDGDLTGLFTGSETIAATLWSGDDQTIAATLAAAWVPGTAATCAPAIKLTATAATVGTLSPGAWRVQVVIDPAGGKHHALPPGAYLTLTAAPGSATALAVYCTAEDLYREFACLDQLRSCHDQTGFAEQRALAREWTDAVIQACWRGGYQDSLGMPSPHDGPHVDRWLQERLDAGALIRTSPNGRRIVRANALYAIALVARPQFSRAEDQGYSFQRIAREYDARAESLIRSSVAELDTTGDGHADIVISLSITRVLRG